MALPVISSNSPSAGYIAWTAFNITFGGVAYSVAASNSNKKFVWWQYNAGAPALQASDTLPTLEEEDILLFLNKNGVGALVPMTDVTDGSLIVTGSILAAAIAADQIQTYHLSSGAVTADEISAGVIGATHIAAGAITSDKLSVGTVSDSLVTNGSFEEFANAMPIGWQGIVTGTGSLDIVTGVASSGTNAARLVLGTTSSKVTLQQTPDRYIPVTSAAGRKWYIGAMVGAGTATTDGLYLRAVWYNASKGYISYNDTLVDQPVTTSFQLFEGQVTPPSTARYMGVEVIMQNPNVITNVYVDEVVAREVVISAQIGDGAITTPKLVANAVTANELSAGAVTATKIAANAVTADKMLVTDRTNFWENPDFEGDVVGQQPRGIVANGNCSVIAEGADGSGKSLAVNALNGANNDVMGLGIIPVEPGDQFYVRYDYKFLNAIGTSNAGVGFRTYGPTKAGITWVNVSYTGTRPTTWTASTPGVYTVPAGTYFIQPWVTLGNNAETTNRFHIDNIVIRRLNGGELVVDGAITATKIATNAVTATHIVAGAVTANKLLVGTAVNALPDPSFMIPEVTDARLARSSGGKAGWTINTPASTGLPSLTRVTTTTNDGFHYSPVTPVTGSAGNGMTVSEGQKWLLQADVETSVSAGVRWNVYKYWADGTVTYVSLSPYNTASGRRQLSYNYTIPAGVVAIDVAMACNISACTWTIHGNAFVGLQSPATLIEDGAIQTNHMTANSISGDRILANTIGAGKLLVGDFENLATINEVHGVTVTSFGQTQVVSGYNSLVTDSGNYLMFKDQAGPVPFKNGDELYYSFTAKATAATTAQFAIYQYNAAGSNKSASTTAFNIGTADTVITGTLTVPSTDVPFGPGKTWVCGLLATANKGIQVKEVVVRRRNGGELIVDGSITATKILAGSIGTSHMTANTINADRLLANTIAAGKLMANSVVASNITAGTITANKLESQLVLASEILAGPVTDTHASMSPTGFRVYAKDAASGNVNEVVRLGVANTDDYFSVQRGNGTYAATISQDGTVSADKFYADTEIYYKGLELQSHLAKAPRGIQAYGVIAQDIGFALTEYGMFDVCFVADATRAYRVHVKTTCASNDTQGMKWRVRSDVGTARPSITSYIQKEHETKSSSTQWLSESWSFVSYPSYQTSGTWTERYLLTAQKLFAGTGTFKYGEVTVEDIGPRIWAVAGINNGGGSPTPAAQQYTKTYTANNSSSYVGANTVYNYDTGRMYQGPSPAGYGDLKSIATFPDMTADLSGATILSMRAYFYFDHWYNNSGGTAKIGVHGFTTVPSTFSQSGTIVDSTGWPKPGGRWVDIPSNHFANFKSGTYRGLSLVGDGTNTTYGIAQRPIIEITYSK